MTIWLISTLTFMSGIFVGRRGPKYGYLGMFVPQWMLKLYRKKTALPAVSNKPEPQGETYGHPRPVLKAVYDALPAPPANHVWELEAVPVVLTQAPADRPWDKSTIARREDSVALECRLINLLADEENSVVDSMQKDLIWEKWWPSVTDWENSSLTRTWVSSYERYPAIRTNDFNDHFVGPFVSWAKKHVNDFKRKELVERTGGEYMIKGGAK